MTIHETVMRIQVIQNRIERIIRIKNKRNTKLSKDREIPLRCDAILAACAIELNQLMCPKND